MKNVATQDVLYQKKFQKKSKKVVDKSCVIKYT